MRTTAFVKYLVLVTLGSVAFVGLLAATVPAVRAYTGMAAATVLLFTAICVGLYAWGKSAAASAQRTAFTNLISLSVFLKMALSMAFLLIYRSQYRPADSWFVAIFLGIYVIYTFFEVWFMMQLAKSSS